LENSTGDDTREVDIFEEWKVAGFLFFKFLQVGKCPHGKSQLEHGRADKKKPHGCTAANPNKTRHHI
jgi:hypothetical protein